MATSLVSRFRPLSDLAAASIYETIREHDYQNDDSDEDPFPDSSRYDHGPIALASPEQQPTGSAYPRHAQRNIAASSRRQWPSRIIGRAGRSTRNIARGVRTAFADHDDFGDDVPASLLIEDNAQIHSPEQHAQGKQKLADAAAGRPRQQWPPSSPLRINSLDEALPLHEDRRSSIGNNTMATASAREKAMWRWANVENLDNFLADVYDYYILKGYWSIILKRFLNLLTVAFVIGFCLFLTQCIDYSKVKGSSKLSEILVQKCTARMGLVPNLILWLATFICITRCFQYLLDLRRLTHLHDFYLHLLNIPESEIQSISWQEVISRLMALRDSNPNIRTAQNPQSRRFMVTQSKQRMDAHDIANRLMRKDNYMIAMINKEIIDATLALPLIGNRQFFTRTLEWHLNYCIMDYVFNSQGQVRQLFLKDTHRKALSEGLRRRFVFAGTTSLIFAPFLIIYFIVQNFFQHFNEYQKDPAQIGSRQYNVYAQWKFREFNELWHLFGKRLKMSHPFATRYINQFPKDKTVQAARFVTFVSGALVSILGLATVLDQENFLGFEITNGRTTIFYLGIFGSIWAIARGMLPDENMIYDSSYSMEEVIEFTHYRPAHWEGRLHTVEVKTEFSQLYQMQIAVLMEEILSMIFTPFVLWFALPRCSDRIIDFFREFTVHVDGLGYVCSFAEFNFKKPGQIGTGGNAGTRATNPAELAALARDDYYSAKDNKLEQSYWGFMNDYARNPKTDVQFPHGTNTRRRTFNPPPPFPSVLSPTVDHVRHTSESEQPKNTQIARAQGGFRISGLGNETGSPPQSLLLDPHHLPGSGSIALASPQSMRPRNTIASSRIATNPGDTIMTTALEEVNEDTTAEAKASEPTSNSQAHQSGGDLGSWKYDEDDDEGVGDSEEDPDAVAQGGGVLGLIRQFQRAHDDDKRGGAGV